MIIEDHVARKIEKEDITGDTFVFPDEVTEVYADVTEITEIAQRIKTVNFNNAEDIKFVVLGAATSKIDVFAPNAENIIFPKGKSLFNANFMDNKSIKKIEAVNAEVVEYRAFSDCNNLETAIVPNCINIRDEAFCGTSLKKIVFSDDILYIGARAFYSSRISTMDVHNAKCSSYAFTKSSIECLKVNSLSKLNRCALQGCSSLKQIEINGKLPRSNKGNYYPNIGRGHEYNVMSAISKNKINVVCGTYTHTYSQKMEYEGKTPDKSFLLYALTDGRYYIVSDYIETVTDIDGINAFLHI